MLRTGGVGGGLSISSILRTGGMVTPAFVVVPAIDACRGTVGSPMSSMLRTGDRGPVFVYGDGLLLPERLLETEPVELTEPLGLAAGGPSSIASTSRLS